MTTRATLFAEPNVSPLHALPAVRTLLLQTPHRETVLWKVLGILSQLAELSDQQLRVVHRLEVWKLLVKTQTYCTDEGLLERINKIITRLFSVPTATKVKLAVGFDIVEGAENETDDVQARKKYRNAFELFSQLKETSSRARLELTFLYYCGLGCAKNDLEALRCFISVYEVEPQRAVKFLQEEKEAFPNGLSKELLPYASRYNCADAKDHALAISFFICAYELTPFQEGELMEDGAFLYDVGLQYMQRAERQPTNVATPLYREAFSFFQQSVEKNFTIARYLMAQMLFFGLGVEKNEEAAIRLCVKEYEEEPHWAHRIFQDVCKDISLKLVPALQNVVPSLQDEAQALVTYALAYDLDPRAMDPFQHDLSLVLRLATWYQSKVSAAPAYSEGVDGLKERVTMLLWKGVDGGSLEARQRLAVCYREGYGVFKNTTFAALLESNTFVTGI